MVAPVAWNEGLLKRSDAVLGGQTTVRVYNTNTAKVIHASFQITEDGLFEPCGEYSIDGVPGTGSRITMSFIDPAGAKTGAALPTGNPVDTLDLGDEGQIPASLVDVSNPGVFVLASDLGVPGDISSDALGANASLMARLEKIRRAGALAMGLDPNTLSVPKVVLLAAPSSKDSNIVCRALSMQQAHKAVPLTLALNLGAACRIPGTLAASVAVGVGDKQSVVIEHASGKLEVGAVISSDGKIESALLHRTARVLMRGEVFYTVEA